MACNGAFEHKPLRIGIDINPRDIKRTAANGEHRHVRSPFGVFRLALDVSQKESVERFCMGCRGTCGANRASMTAESVSRASIRLFRAI